MLDGLPVIREAFPRTVRLVTTARLRPPVLEELVAPEEVAALAELEGATSQRLITQARGAAGVEAHEMVFGVPYANFINASFAYAKPREPNRYSGTDRGAWYAALEIETSLAEVCFHLTEAIAVTGVFEAVVDYAELSASFAGEFVDLRSKGDHPSLDPRKELGYPAGNVLADAARARGLVGIVYPSVRRAGGTCLVALWPQAVQSVAQGKVYRLTWSGDRAPSVEEVAGH